MHLPLCPGVTFEPGRLHTLLGPPECVAALLADPATARFPAVCICPEDSALADRLDPVAHRCRLRRVRSARELLRELAGAREAIVVVEHAPALYDDDGAVRRSLGHHSAPSRRSRWSCSMPRPPTPRSPRSRARPTGPSSSSAAAQPSQG